MDETILYCHNFSLSYKLMLFNIEVKLEHMMSLTYMTLKSLIYPFIGYQVNSLKEFFLIKTTFLIFIMQNTTNMYLNIFTYE